MKREDVLVSREELDRQREFEKKIRAMFEDRGLAPAACVETYGCQQNAADGELLAGMLREMGFALISEPAAADLVILNTCAVREHAQQRVFGNLGALSHSKRAKPEQLICLCGCMAQQPQTAERIKTSYRLVDLLFGPQSLWRFPELLWQVYEGQAAVFAPPEPDRIAEGVPAVRSGGVRAWVSVMYGCNNFCSYCIVPYVRGRERSRDPQAVIDEVRSLAAAGYRDITLLGQNVNSYGNDLHDGFRFPELLETLDEIQGDFWLHFISSHPKDATPRLFDVMAKGRHIARQLHLPFQSGSDRVLAAMNRRYTRRQYLDLIREARQRMPDLVLTSDVIVGFPGESEQEAMETISLVEEVGFDALFTFLYSPRPGTKAAQLPDPAPRSEKQKWFDALLSVQNAASARRHAAYIGKTVRVLVDGKSTDAAFPLTGRTEGGRLVRLTGEEAGIGSFRQVQITGSNTWALYGETVPPPSQGKGGVCGGATPRPHD